MECPGWFGGAESVGRFAEAEARALEVMTHLRNGEDPSGLPKAAKKPRAALDTVQAPATVTASKPTSYAPGTFGHMIEAFYTEWVLKENAAATAKYQRWAIDKHLLPVLGKVQLARIDADRIDDLLADISETARVSANRVRALLSKAFNWGRRGKKFKVQFNPVTGSKKNKEVASEDRLFIPDVIALGKAWATSGDELKYAALFPLLTGCRRGVVLNLSLAEVSNQGGLLLFPANTPGLKKAREVYVPDVAVSFLDKIPVEIDPDKLGRCVTRLIKAAGIESKTGNMLSIHDFWRTFMSIGVDKPLGLDESAVDALVGHSRGKIRDTYHRRSVETMAELANTIGDHIAGLLGIAEAKGNATGKVKGKVKGIPVGSGERVPESDLVESLVGETSEYEERTGGFLVKVTETPASMLHVTQKGSRSR